ncbi:DNA recombination protein RmuC [Candidatus Nomurabacteria bacterium]|nr:DNA recombination protein RmuC [Candidatus Nomurabacteria bacterium]
MENILSIIIAILLGGIIVYFFLNKNKKEDKDQSFLLLQQQMNALANTLDSKLTESRRDMQDTVRVQFSESQQLLKDINEQMSKSLIDVAREQTKTNEATRDFINIAEKLSNLEKTLKHQKQRGNWGEASLELILSNTLAPGEYKMQHIFSNKETVDAVIITKDGMIPIDAKFSLDNYDRVVHAVDDRQREELEKEFKNDLKKRIDETAKYIRPEEGTLPFAFMYIPAEAIYYDLLVNEVGSVKVNTRNLIDYAYNEKKVIIISPTTFMAYLQSILFGFKAFKFEKKMGEVIKNVETLGKHLNAYADYHVKLGNALNTVTNHYNSSNKELKKIDKDVLRIAGSSPELNLLEVEKPKTQEE